MGLAALALSAFLAVALQDVPVGPPVPPEVAAERPPSLIPEPASAPESSRPLIEPAPRAARVLEDRPETGPGLGGFVGASVFVMALLGGAFLLLKRYGRNSRLFGSGGPIRVLARKPLGQKQEIVLVEVGTRVLVVGSTRDRLTTLGEMDRPDDIAVLRANLPDRKDDSLRLAFRQSLREGIKEEEEPRRPETVYASIADELAQIRKTVGTWRA